MHRLLLVGLALPLLAVAAAGQTLTGLTPDLADPGDLLIVRGTGLDAVTHVRFHATVGGALGVDERDVVPHLVTPTEAHVLVPEMAAFAPPTLTPPGSPIGGVSVFTSDSPGKASFLFLQGAFPWGSMKTIEAGSDQSGPAGKPMTSLDLDDDLPVPGATSVGIRLENGPTSAVSPNPNLV